jgi:hypothetical protein
MQSEIKGGTAVDRSNEAGYLHRPEKAAEGAF